MTSYRPSKKTRRIIGIAGLVLVAAWFAAGTGAYEEPDYEVIDRGEAYEIRQYSPYLAAETEVEGSFSGAGNQAFRRLFGYISGDNRVSGSMKTVAPADQGSGQKMEMTIPVFSSAPPERGSSRYRYQFVLPKEHSLESAPIPEDTRVRVREVPGRRMAVLQYSGRSSEASFRQHEQSLLEALAADGLRTIGEPLFARYDGPFTLWFLRRNEVMVEIEAEDGASVR